MHFFDRKCHGPTTRNRRRLDDVPHISHDQLLAVRPTKGSAQERKRVAYGLRRQWSTFHAGTRASGRTSLRRSRILRRQRRLGSPSVYICAMAVRLRLLSRSPKT